MSNAERFLSAFNRIERALRRMSNSDRGIPFSTVVEKASQLNAGVRRLKDDLREFAELRNAIVHETRNGQVVAEPTEWAVAEIERIASLLTDPPKVIPLFAKKVLALETEAPIMKAVECMREHSFSQIPIYSGTRFVGLLTTNTIVRWLGARIAAGEFDLATTHIGAVLEHTEEVDIYCFLKKNATLFEVLEKFQDYEKGARGSKPF